jgi:hypothetical protein
MDAASGRVWDGPCLGPGLGLGLGGSVPKQGHRRLVVEVSRRAGCRVSALMAAVGPMTGRSCVVRAAPTRMASSPMSLATSYVVDPSSKSACLPSAVCRPPSAAPPPHLIKPRARRCTPSQPGTSCRYTCSARAYLRPPQVPRDTPPPIHTYTPPSPPWRAASRAGQKTSCFCAMRPPPPTRPPSGP